MLRTRRDDTRASPLTHVLYLSSAFPRSLLLIMLLCRALSSWVPALPYLVIEVLHDDEVLSGLSVASNGTAHAERVPQLRKVYLIEPSARQVVRVTCLRKVSQRSPLVFCWFLHHVFFLDVAPGVSALPLFAGACLIRILVLYIRLGGLLQRIDLN